MVIYSAIILSLVDKNGKATWVIIAAFPAGCLLVFGPICYLVSPEIAHEKQEGTNSGACLRVLKLFKHGSFVLVVTMYALAMLVQQITFSLMPLYIVHTIGLELTSFTQIAIVMIGMTVVTVVCLTFTAKFFEKRTILATGMIVGIIAFVGFYFVPGDIGTSMPPGTLNGTIDTGNFSTNATSITPSMQTSDKILRYLVFFLSGLLGISFAISFTLPDSMMADVTDLALLKSKSNQEGVMYSSMEIFQSILQAIALYFLGYILNAKGYISDLPSNERQPQPVRDVIRMLFCFIGLGAFGVVFLLSLLYRLSRKQHAQIRDQLDQLKDKSGKGELKTHRFRALDPVFHFSKEGGKHITKASKEQPNMYELQAVSINEAQQNE